MELQQKQAEIIKGLNGLKEYLVQNNAPLNYVNLINDSINIISMPIPFLSLKQEDFLPLEKTDKAQIEINNSTIILTSENLSKNILDNFAIPPSDCEKL